MANDTTLHRAPNGFNSVSYWSENESSTDIEEPNQVFEDSFSTTSSSPFKKPLSNEYERIISDCSSNASSYNWFRDRDLFEVTYISNYDMPIFRLEIENEEQLADYSQFSASYVQDRNEYLLLLSHYYEDLEGEEEFNRVNRRSIMPKYEEYERIKWNISQHNYFRFYEFLKIYRVLSELEEIDNWNLKKAQKVLELLDDEFFILEGSPKYETYSLIEKFKINIFYQLSKTDEIDEIRKWLIICEEIRIKWKYINMVSLIKIGCNLFMKCNEGNKIENYKMLIILNKFIGNRWEFRDKLGNEAFEWLSANYKRKDLHRLAKSMLDSLSKNTFWLSKKNYNVLLEIQKELYHWTFDANRNIKIHKGRIKNWIKTGRSSKLNIIDIGNISNKKIHQYINSFGAEFYECFYRDEKALIKEYKFNNRNLKTMERIFNETANLVYLSDKKHNKGNIFINYFGLYLERIDEINENEEWYSLNIVMQWCSGTLSNYIELFNCDEETLSFSIDSILNGYSLLHSYGIAHSDITPENILVKEINGEMILKLANYDISSAIYSNYEAVSRDSSSPFLGGTCQFAAPEVRYLLDNGVVKAKINKMRADAYSLGLVFIYLLFNVFPPEGHFDRNDFIEFHIQHTKFPWLKALLENMLCENPRKRKKIGELIELKKELQSAR